MKTLITSDVPTTWVVSTIGEVCSRPQYGYTTKAANIGNLRLLRTTDITSGSVNWETVPYCSENPEDPEKYILKDGDVVVSRAGSVGVSLLLTKPQRAVFASYLIRLRPLIDASFLASFLQGPSYWRSISEEKLGIALSNVNATKLTSIAVPVPPSNEQRRIVAKIEELFSELDKGVESLKKAREQLKVYRQAVLKHAFEGKLTAQWREENKDKLESAEQLLTRIKQEHRIRYERQLEEWKAAVQTWEESGEDGKKPPKPKKPISLTSVASGSTRNVFWAEIHLDELAAETVLGKMLDREKNRGVSRHYLGNINVRWGRFDLEHLKTMKVEDRELARCSLRKGDLVVCEGGEPGRCAVWTGEDDAMLIQKALHRVRFTESYSPYFANYFLAYAASSGALSEHLTGSTIKHLTGKGLSNVVFPLCAMSEQIQIVRYLDYVFALCDELDSQMGREVERSASLRQSVLRIAFSGRLVAQDPNDEPAARLLERINSEKVTAIRNTSFRGKSTRARATA